MFEIGAKHIMIVKKLGLDINKSVVCAGIIKKNNNNFEFNLDSGSYQPDLSINTSTKKYFDVLAKIYNKSIQFIYVKNVKTLDKLTSTDINRLCTNKNNLYLVDKCPNNNKGQFELVSNTSPPVGAKSICDIDKLINTNKIFVLTYNVQYQAFQAIKPKSFCTDPKTNKNICVTNIVNAILDKSEEIAQKQNISNSKYAALDFIGLQEITVNSNSGKDWKLLESAIKNKLNNNDFFDKYYNIISDKIVGGYVTLLYNKTKYNEIDHGTVLLKNPIGPNRGSVYGIFERISDKKKILFASCHFPHDGQNNALKNMISEFAKKKINYSDLEVIICGDFNQDVLETDIKNTIQPTTFDFIDKTQLTNLPTPIITCCNGKKNGRAWFDQIYHTKGLGSNIEYFIDNQWEYELITNKFYTSDHKPVFGIISG